MLDLFVECIFFGYLLFLFIGVDVFGFWEIIIRKIRGGLVISKGWVVFFICWVIRVVYIEVLEDMMIFVFINFFIWFIVIWGCIRIICFDRGINFVGVVNEL